VKRPGDRHWEQNITSEHRTRLPLDAPFLLAYEGVQPLLKGPVRRSEPGSAVVGRVTLGGQATLECFAVLRADGHVIQVGADFHLGVHSTVHIAHALYGTTIGDRVTVGANAVVHACTVGDDCIIQDAVSVLDGATVGSGSVVAAGSVVFPRSVLPPGRWCEGVPAVPVRPVDAAERQALHERMRADARAGASVAAAAGSDAIVITGRHAGYVAATVTGTGEMRMGEGSSLWFGCVVEAAVLGVDVATGSNIQDNSVLRSSARPVTIGADCTIGHNVLLHDCVVGARVLVGMGSTLAPGTVVGDEVLIAAGSSTTPGQQLEGGWLWAGRPARPVARLDERKHLLIQKSAAVYREYALEFAANQAAALGTAAARNKGAHDVA